MSAELKAKIESKTAHIGIIGLGYVGLPLAVELAREGFSVTGFDISQDRVNQLNRGESYVEDIPSDLLASVTGESGKFKATTDFSILKSIDAVSVCVPTPLGKTKDPDISYVLSARKEITKYIHPQMLVILESTTYPGTTEEILEPMAKEANLELGKDLFLAFSPERIDPGNPKYYLRNTPKVIGGATEECTKIATMLYSQIVEQVVPVSSTQVAEMVKLLENTYRAVNIGLVNEVAIMCQVLGIDTWEVIDAAATKPFGYTPFYPGPGLGGHCIPIDPLYLSWKLRTLNYNARFIDLASEVNTGMPNHVVTLVSDTLNNVERSVRGSKILLLGMAYKPDISDLRESPALDIFRLLEERGAKVTYNDPHAKTFKKNGMCVESVELNDEMLAEQDLVVITTNHKVYDYDRIVEKSRLILDTRNATKGMKNAKIVRL